MELIEIIIGLDVYTNKGNKYSVKDFFNTPHVGYKVQMLHDLGFEAIPVGESSECVSGVCPIK